MSAAAKNPEKRVYNWTEGARISLDPNVAGPILEKVRGQGGSADDVLFVAKDPKSPLHAAFEWSDERAAYQHRLATARLLLRSIEVRIVIEKRPPQAPVKCNVALLKAPPAERYQPVVAVMADSEKRKELFEQLKRELFSFASRNEHFRGYPEMKEVFKAIDNLRGI